MSVLSAYAVIRPDVRFSFHAKDAKKVESGTWERPVVKATPDIGKNVLQSICLVYGNDVASKIQFKSLDINVDYEDDDENGGLTRGKATVHAWIPIGTSGGYLILLFLNLTDCSNFVADFFVHRKSSSQHKSPFLS